MPSWIDAMSFCWNIAFFDSIKLIGSHYLLSGIGLLLVVGFSSIMVSTSVSIASTNLSFWLKRPVRLLPKKLLFRGDEFEDDFGLTTEGDMA